MIERESLRVYQLSVFVLAVEWILFGSMHFTSRLQTEAQIPPGVPWKTFIAVVTGMVEVTVGILLLITKTRKYAAIATLVLLALFLPAIYRMLAYDSAMPMSPEARNFARVVLVPNHVFMALCAVYLVRWPRRPTIDAPPPAPRPRFSWPRPTFAGGSATLMVALIMLLANLAGFWAVWVSPLDGPTARLWAMMCLALGGLFGFLFGIPRVTLEGTERTHRPNSNIEVVSDWLTKIIVGVGLLQFHSLGRFLDRVSADLGQALGGANPGAASAFAKALIIFFFVAGVIQGYLLTRMYLAGRFEESESPLPRAATADKPVTA